MKRQEACQLISQGTPQINDFRPISDRLPCAFSFPELSLSIQGKPSACLQTAQGFEPLLLRGDVAVCYVFFSLFPLHEHVKGIDSDIDVFQRYD